MKFVCKVQNCVPPPTITTLNGLVAISYNYGAMCENKEGGVDVRICMFSMRVLFLSLEDDLEFLSEEEVCVSYI